MEVTVALDAMGGDAAPGVVVEGALLAAREVDAKILLVGPEGRLASMVRDGDASAGIEIVNAGDVIEMDEHPANAIRRKRDSSIVVGTGLVRDGRAQAFVSAGNTGAVMAAGLFELKRAPGVERPALAAPFPTARGQTLLIDVGANADSRPEHLAQFGLMGSVYMERVFGLTSPRVGLISIGEEETKGSAVVQQAHARLRELPINFVGNVEGKDVPAGLVDVAVCDGFLGNVLLKFAEGTAGAVVGVIRDEINRSWLARAAALGLIPTFRRARRRMDYAERGGAPLLGLNGICIVAHGRSNALAIKNAVRVAAQCVRQEVATRVAGGVAATASSA